VLLIFFISKLLRYMIYDPLTSEEATKTNGVMLNGHTDFNSISTLISQPISALQVLMPDNVWRYVMHREGALVINIGDQLSFMSGGILKGTMHRGKPWKLSLIPYDLTSFTFELCAHLVIKDIFVVWVSSISPTSSVTSGWISFLQKRYGTRVIAYLRVTFQQRMSACLSRQ
jgi:hypothetical protein